MESPITEFYNGKNVFITGVTGFVAKSVVEKLLRLTEVNMIYVLIREKNGRNIASRMEEIKRNMVFDRVKQEKGLHVLDKVHAIRGDVACYSMNLSKADEKTLRENVDVVIHSAATLDFELNVKLVVNVNLMGTKRILNFCEGLPNLKAFVYVSTAYVNADRSYALEKLYPKPGNPDNFISLLKMTDEDADKIFKKLINGHVNSYTVSKALAEHEVDAYSKKFPVAVVRPSMIVGAWQDPCPGWTDSKNGPNGFFMGAGWGVIRRLPVDKDLVYDYIPVDIVANTLIAAGWKIGTERSAETRIYHCTSSTIKPFKWNLLETKINSLLINYPLKSAVWYPTIKLHGSFTVFRISTLLFHFLPGIFFDFALRLSGRKPMLLRLHYKVDCSLRRLAPFIFKEWFFDSTNTYKLHKTFSEKDRKIYNLDIRKINYETFFENAVIGVRRHLSRESDATLADARKKVKILFFLNLITQFLFLLLVSWMLTSFFRPGFLTGSWITYLVYLVFSYL